MGEFLFVCNSLMAFLFFAPSVFFGKGFYIAKQINYYGTVWGLDLHMLFT